MNVLVINSGSSSIKFQIIETDTQELLCKGLVELTDDLSTFTYTQGENKIKKELKINNTDEGIEIILKQITDPETGCLKDLSEIKAVGHRVVHGGEYFKETMLVNEESKKAVADLFDLAPLHNRANYAGIVACEKEMPGVPMAIAADTAFLSTMPESSYLYALPYEYYTKHSVRRYGAHGTSHRFVSAEAIKLLGKPAEDTKIITCHVGNGASVSAIVGGKTFDTSMGFTPLAGLMMGTRTGDIDPSVIPYLMEKEGVSAEELVLDIFNKKSGLLGVTGISNDMRDIDAAYEKGDEKAKLALEMYTQRIKGYIGNYYARMNGADAIVFTAGVGENDALMRSLVCKDMEALGIKIDEEKNNTRGTVDITAADSKVKVYVIPTNEELVIAMDTAALVAGK
ncbi:MAG: acetate kinase [Clostridia bacterium]|nr:acetate kinase [Clostridia bacterium]